MAARAQRLMREWEQRGRVWNCAGQVADHCRALVMARFAARSVYFNRRITQK